MDKITVTGIECYAYHGVLEQEKQDGQAFLMDASLTLDTSLCHDMLDNTVNYSDFTCSIVEFCQSTQYNLIETLANRLAQHLLLQYPFLQQLALTVHKPSAPIPAKFQDVSVTVTRGWKISYLALGSNLGDRKHYLDGVSAAIQAEPGIVELAKSSYYETEPYGVLDQPKFLNAAIKVKTIFTPMELLAFARKLEEAAGRQRKRHWGERTLDVDLLFYEDMQILTPDLILPHPELCRRRFVLEPLCEIEPHFIHPTKKLSVRELLEQLSEAGEPV